MTLMMTSAQVVETSVNVTNNSPSRDYSHPDDQTTQTKVPYYLKELSILGVSSESARRIAQYHHAHKKLDYSQKDSYINVGYVRFGSY